MAERHLRRSVLFDTQDEFLVAREGTDQVIKIKTVNQDIGQPVPVLFGTRFVEPTIVSWGATFSRIFGYYQSRTGSIVSNKDDIFLEDDPRHPNYQGIRSINPNIPLHIISVRMAVCLGDATIVEYRAENLLFYVIDATDPRNNLFDFRATTIASNIDTNVMSLWRTSASAYYLFSSGHITAPNGGLGLPFGAPTVSDPTNSHSHFWLSKGNLPVTNKRITTTSMDGHQAYSGLTSIWFSNFNFGGKVPLPKWRLLTTRVDKQTRQDKDTGQYLAQWNEFDSIITAPDVSRNTRGLGPTFGQIQDGPTMNPAHALREALIDKSWGASIPEDKLDDTSFHICADTCKRDGLDFCYLWDKLEPVNKLIQIILDYIDAVLYYDPHVDLYRVKVIRDDYVINAIPQFAEHNISKLTNYKRQHGDESVNSVTIIYHDYKRDINDAVTLVDQVAVNLAGKTIGASFTHEGCATKEAALRVAERELTAISQSLISFSIHVDDSNQTLGIGDAIHVSWQDLNIKQLVMRILRIHYGDGTTAGITLDLIQDVFADIHRFGELIKPQDIDVVRPSFPLPVTQIVFYEQGYFDLADPSTAFTVNPKATWIKAGRIADYLNISIAIENVAMPFAIGALQVAIPGLTNDPRTSGQIISVSFTGGQVPPETKVRINDELFLVSVRAVLPPFYELVILERAVEDSVAAEHYVGSHVTFLDLLWKDSQVWDGSAYTVYLQSGIYNDREAITPPVSGFVGRGNLAPAPRYVKIRDQFVGYNVWVDGDLTIKWQARARDGNTIDSGQQTRIKVTTLENTVISTQVIAVASKDSSGNYPEQTVTISKAIIETALGHSLGTIEVEVDSIWQGRRSWQSWKTRVDWASYDRSGQRQGWNFKWGFNWGGGGATGFGYDWDNNYSD